MAASFLLISPRLYRAITCSAIRASFSVVARRLSPLLLESPIRTALLPTTSRLPSVQLPPFLEAQTLSVDVGHDIFLRPPSIHEVSVLGVKLV